MRTYLADIIPKIQKYSKRLDHLTRLTNQHWVSLGDISESKRVFMFRDNNKLLIAENGIIVDKGTWEYLGNQSLLLEISNGGYLLKHGFFDENVIALKLDSTNSYAFFVNETKFESELNSINDILNFLENKYLKNNSEANLSSGPKVQNGGSSMNEGATYKTKQGLLKLKGEFITLDEKIIRATIEGRTAPDGRYRLDFMWHVTIKNGIVV